MQAYERTGKVGQGHKKASSVSYKYRSVMQNNYE